MHVMPTELFRGCLHFCINAKVSSPEVILQILEIGGSRLPKVEVVGLIGTALPTEGGNDTCAIHFHEHWIYFRILRYSSPINSTEHNSHFLLCTRFQTKSYLPGTDWANHLRLLPAFCHRHPQNLSCSRLNDVWMVLTLNQCLVCHIILRFFI